MLFYGIRIQSAFWVAPHLFCQVFLIILAFITAIVALFLVIFSQYAGIRRLVGHDPYEMSDQSEHFTTQTVSIGRYDDKLQPRSSLESAW